MCPLQEITTAVLPPNLWSVSYQVLVCCWSQNLAKAHFFCHTSLFGYFKMQAKDLNLAAASAEEVGHKSALISKAHEM